MKVSVIGLSNSGKTTVFNALTGQNIETTLYPTTSGEPNRGIVKVPDARIDKLSEIFRPKKTTYATIEYVDYIGMTKGDMEQNRKVFDLELHPCRITTYPPQPINQPQYRCPGSLALHGNQSSSTSFAQIVGLHSGSIPQTHH